ncbi:hypothetical protein NP493_839g01046 [Ridgeia piscesae]|uniref:Uncharacterized protein n=1 Tax=Ridgeia piscesae TaxID=27915 RepID=A0AAD9KM80_RIDPI|nr:hypothetical protein NP493_839g01046 [Ridgeia piscesae]
MRLTIYSSTVKGGSDRGRRSSVQFIKPAIKVIQSVRKINVDSRSVLGRRLVVGYGLQTCQMFFELLVVRFSSSLPCSMHTQYAKTLRITCNLLLDWTVRMRALHSSGWQTFSAVWLKVLPLLNSWRCSI